MSEHNAFYNYNRDKDDLEKFDDNVLKTGLFDDYCPKILNAIQSNFCTIPQIMRFCSISDIDVFLSVLKQMRTNRLIEKVDKGQLEFFFEWNNQPKHFWLTGNGKVESDDEIFTNKIKEINNMQPIPTTNENGNNNRGYAFDSMKKHGDKHKKDKKFIDSNEIERLASEGKTLKAMAEILGVGFSTLTARVSSVLDVKTALTRGRKKWSDKLNAEKPKVEEVPKAEVSKVSKGVSVSFRPMKEISPKVEVQFEKPSEPELKKAEEMFKPFVEATTKPEFRSIYEKEEAELLQWLNDIQEKKKAEVKLYSLVLDLSPAEKELLIRILEIQLEDSI